MVSIAYMVAGKSSRFGGKPKHLTPVGSQGETLLEVSLNQALQSDFSKIYFIVSQESQLLLTKLFGNSYHQIPIIYLLQDYDPKTRDRPWGTCDAVSLLAPHLKEPVVICNGDDLYGVKSFQKAVQVLKEHQENVSIGFKLVNVIPEQGIVNRGFYQTKQENGIDLVESIHEKTQIQKSQFSPDQLEQLVNMNFIGLMPETVQMLAQINYQFKKDHSNDRRIESYLPTSLSQLIESQRIKMLLFSTQEKWYGITNPGDQESIIKALQGS